MGRRIAISVVGPGGLVARLDPRFGRAAAFLMVDLESREILREVENEAAGAAHGAGTGAAATMSKNTVDAVISGRFGPKAYQALEALSIEMWIAPNGITAEQALDSLAAGTLEKMVLQRF